LGEGIILPVDRWQCGKWQYTEVSHGVDRVDCVGREEGRIEEGHIEERRIEEGHIEEGHIEEGHIEEGRIEEGRIEEGHIEDLEG
jgi:hypothetical protein